VLGFVDVHSHVVPSGDDGAQRLEEAVQLCRLAATSGTSVLFATPHAHAAWDHHPWTSERERLFGRCFPHVKAAAGEVGLELRCGYEVFPTVLRDCDPERFALEGTRAVLVEFPGDWLALRDDSALLMEAADRIAARELVPVVAHPERSIGLRSSYEIAQELVERGCLLCPNSDSLLGRNGPTAQSLVERLIEDNLVALIASDGHRLDRPPRLDLAHQLLVERYGVASVERLFDGSALPWVTDRCAQKLQS